MAIPAFETSKGLHTLDPGVAKMLDVIALCQMTLSLAGSDFYKDTGEGSKQMTVAFGGMLQSKRKGAERQQTNRPHVKGIWPSFA
jgi:hypothetical protein